MARPPESGAPGGPAESAPVLLQVRDLRFSFGDHFALEVEDFTLRRGEKVAIVGQNGSGKTTLLRLLAGLERPSSCGLRVDPVAGSSAAVSAPGALGFLRQQPYIFSGSTTENLAYPLRVRGWPTREIAERLTAVFDLLDLGSCATRSARLLSGGEQKRVALGRVLIAQPQVLFLDEPDAHLDAHSRAVIERVLTDTPATVLLTTHDLRFAHRVAQRVVHLRDGRVTAGLPQNTLTGQAAGSALTTRAGLTIRLAQPVAPGPLKIVLDPRNLVLSLEPLTSSMLNQLRGRVVSARDHGTAVWLEVDCGDTLTVIISHDSYTRLGLNVGHEVWVSFKANAVEVL